MNINEEINNINSVVSSGIITNSTRYVIQEPTLYLIYARNYAAASHYTHIYKNGSILAGFGCDAGAGTAEPLFIGNLKVDDVITFYDTRSWWGGDGSHCHYVIMKLR